MASAETWVSSELDEGILLSEKEENGIVTRTYISPLLELPMEENRDPLVLPKECPTPYFCPHCGNGIGSSGAFTMHLRACQRRLPTVLEEEELPAKPQVNNRSCHVKFESKEAHLKLDKPVKTWNNSKFGPFRCIFCHQEFEVPFGLGQMRRRYACDECGQKARAEEADRKNKPKIPRKLLGCNRCGKEYKLEGFLVRHQMLCQGITPKRKREYEVYEVTKKMKREDEVAELKLEGEFHEMSKIKREDECHEVS